MTLPHNADGIDDVLALELRVDGALHRFELAPEEDGALVVGASAEANLRLRGRGIAPVHFHFERQGDEVWVIPTASAGSLRLDTRRLTSAARVPTRSVIDVCGVRVEVRLLRGLPEQIDTEDVPTLKRPGKEELQAAHMAYARALPDEDAETRVGEEPIPSPLVEQATRAVAPVRRDPEQFGTSTMKLSEFEALQKALRGVKAPSRADRAPLPTTTERIELPADPQSAPFFPPDPVPIAASPTIEVKGPTPGHSGVVSDGAASERSPASPTEASVALEDALETTAFDMPPIPEPEDTPRSPGVAFTRSVTPDPDRKQPIQRSRKPTRNPAILTTLLQSVLQAASRLGIAVHRHPVRVGAAAIAISFVVAALAAGLSRTLSANGEPAPHPDVARAAEAPKRGVAPSRTNPKADQPASSQLPKGVATKQKSKQKGHRTIEILVPPRPSNGEKGEAPRLIVRPASKDGKAVEDPTKSDVAVAVGYLVTGRHLQAARAYKALAAQANDPTYGAIARLLERHADCSAAKTRPQTCPEVQ